MRLLYLDFETRSRADLRRVGAHRYAADPSTEVVLAAWTVEGLVGSDDTQTIVHWRPADDEALDLLPGPPMYPALDSWKAYAADPSVTVVAHNAEFEREILRQKFGIDVPPHRWRCTAALAARHGLPRRLGAACEALGLAQRKDARGERLVHKFSKPKRNGAFTEPEDAPEDWSDFEEYNEQDVRAMLELHRALPPLSDQEQRLWELTVEMNGRGVALDGAALEPARATAQAAEAALAARFEALTGVRPSQVAKAAAALGVESLAKAEVRRQLRRPDLEPRVREALEARRSFAKSSVKKLAAMRDRVEADGRLRGALAYCGAERTGRWSSWGVQLQNMPRGLGEGTGEAFEALAAGGLDLLYPDPLRTVSEMLKGFLVGPFLVGDFAQVEARVLAWLAGQRDLLQAFADGADVYCDMATAIYGHKVSKVDHDAALGIAKRQLGKVAVLGCGYGLGPEKLRKQLDEAFDVVATAETCERTVAAYRRRYPRIPKLWNLLEAGFVHVVEAHPAGSVQVGPVRMGYRELHGRPFAYIQLPSGRALWYFNPQIGRQAPPAWPGDRGPCYFGRNIYAGGRWEQVPTYGGKLAENVTQAVSRDLLAEAMLRLDAAGFALSFTVHDEVVAEGGDLGEFKRLLVQPPGWAAGLPISADAFETERYRK